MGRMFRVALALSVLAASAAQASSVPASAVTSIVAAQALPAAAAASIAVGGTQIVAAAGKDFGGYWDIGTLGGLGLDLKNTAGKAWGGWVRPDETGIIPVLLTWFGVSAMTNQFNAGLMLNTRWKADNTDYGPQIGAVLVLVCGTNGLGWAYWVDVSGSVNINDGNYHFFYLTFSGLTSGKPTALTLYVDSFVFNVLSVGTDVSDSPALTGSVANFTKNVYIGCDGKTDLFTPIDMSSSGVEDLRIYMRALSSDEVNQIRKTKGRDMIRRGLLSRYPFWVDGKDLGTNQYTAVKHNNAGGSSNPTIESTKKLSGTRRKVMRIDIPRLLEPAKNEDLELLEPHHKVAA